MDVTIDEARIQRMLQKNQATSYGLTLVVGLPFAQAFREQAAALQEELEKVAAGAFTWYQPAQMHATVYAPKRGDYARSGPLRGEEMPGLDAYLAHLAGHYAQLAPFVAQLGTPTLTPDGVLIFHEMQGMARPAPPLPALPPAWLDKPKHSGGGLVCSIGYLRQPERLQAAERRAAISETLVAANGQGATAAPIEHVWLVHYRTRTLGDIVGRLAFPLGRRQEMDSAQMYAALGLAG